MTKPEDAKSLLSRLDRIKRLIMDYRPNIQPEHYRLLIEDVDVIDFNIKQLQSHIDDSMLHRTHTLKELFDMARCMGK